MLFGDVANKESSIGTWRASVILQKDVLATTGPSKAFRCNEIWNFPDWRNQFGSSCVRVRSLQSCPTLLWCDSIDSSLPGFSVSRQEYWSGLLCSPPRDLPNPGMESVSLMSLALAGGFFFFFFFNHLVLLRKPLALFSSLIKMSWLCCLCFVSNYGFICSVF